MSNDRSGRVLTTWCQEAHPTLGGLCRLPGWPHEGHVCTTRTGGDARWTTAPARTTS